MPRTLLLADDSLTIQKVVGLSFAGEDIEVVSVDNGDDAIERAAEIRPHIVLADVMMPGKSGYEVCEALAANPATRHIPVLLLTGIFESFDLERAREVGAEGHITKPFEAQTLVDRVRETLASAPPPEDTAPVSAPTPEPQPLGDSQATVLATPPPGASDDLVPDDDMEFDDFADTEGELDFSGDPLGLDEEADPLLPPPGEAEEVRAETSPEIDLGSTRSAVELSQQAAGQTSPAAASEDVAGFDFTPDPSQTASEAAIAARLEPLSDFAEERSTRMDPDPDQAYSVPAEPADAPLPPAPRDAAPWPAEPGPAQAAQTAAPAQASNLDPQLTERLHETLEKIAWEAFADLSEQVTRQALRRVEAIAWEVIPQMAEAMIREEIRRLKDDEE